VCVLGSFSDGNSDYLYLKGVNPVLRLLRKCIFAKEELLTNVHFKAAYFSFNRIPYHHVQVRISKSEKIIVWVGCGWIIYFLNKWMTLELIHTSQVGKDSVQAREWLIITNVN